ncbi:derlin-1-like [Dysidea avara]|uniref:derlin-1-like n=1 Tax=Dysidea avara TaxID=196820 RepID=UPI0033289D41
MYVWCQLNADVIVSFWFGMRFKAMYLPWVFAGLNFILQGGGVNELIGILVGHLYYFLKYCYPEEYGGRELLHTPEILYKYFPNCRGGVSGFGAPQPTARRYPGDDNRHNWGAGQQLGGH